MPPIFIYYICIILVQMSHKFKFNGTISTPGIIYPATKSQSQKLLNRAETCKKCPSYTSSPSSQETSSDFSLWKLEINSSDNQDKTPDEIRLETLPMLYSIFALYRTCSESSWESYNSVSSKEAWKRKSSWQSVRCDLRLLFDKANSYENDSPIRELTVTKRTVQKITNMNTNVDLQMTSIFSIVIYRSYFVIIKIFCAKNIQMINLRVFTNSFSKFSWIFFLTYSNTLSMISWNYIKFDKLLRWGNEKWFPFYLPTKYVMTSAIKFAEEAQNHRDMWRMKRSAVML